MDRRFFFKTLLSSSLLSPLFMSLKSIKNASHLYLLSDSPQSYITKIFQALRKKGLIYGHRFTFLNQFPLAENLKRVLRQDGWRHVSLPSQADLCFSFSHLKKPVDPSFTLVKAGKILDIRSNGLAPFWLQMKREDHSASLLTVASFKEKKASYLGKYVSVFKDGRKIDTISLNKKAVRTYTTASGHLTLRVEEGKASVSESSCLHKICSLSPPVFLAGERIICAPNNFLLEIEGSAFVDTSIG